MKKETKSIIKTGGIILFLLYVMLLVYLLFFSEAYGRVGQAERGYRYNLVPFVEIGRFWNHREQLGMNAVYVNIVGNVLAFVPYGFILPIITGRMRSGFLIVLSGFGLSLTVEIIQLVTKVGCFDVDDLILNTIGAALGYLAFAILNYIRRMCYGKKI